MADLVEAGKVEALVLLAKDKKGGQHTTTNTQDGDRLVGTLFGLAMSLCLPS